MDKPHLAEAVRVLDLMLAFFGDCKAIASRASISSTTANSGQRAKSARARTRTFMRPSGRNIFRKPVPLGATFSPYNHASSTVLAAHGDVRMRNRYSINDQCRMVLHKNRWTLDTLAVQIGVSRRHAQKLLHKAEERFQRLPKGAEELEQLFLSIYPDPTPHHLLPLSEAVDKIAWLKRTKKKNGSLLKAEIAHWMKTLRFFEPPLDLSNAEKYTYHNLAGHIWFCRANDFVEADLESCPDLQLVSEEEAVRLSVREFEYARDNINPTHLHPKMQRAYKLHTASTVMNLGAAMFMAHTANASFVSLKALIKAYEGGDPGATSEGTGMTVLEAADFFHKIDPLDPRVPYNMACWFSYRESLAGCATWYGRLVEADKAFLDVDIPHHWMRKSMRADSDFRYLIEHLDEIKAALDQSSRIAA
jgi:hypothetical protein